jgi:hypothetical protein
MSEQEQAVVKEESMSEQEQAVVKEESEKKLALVETYASLAKTLRRHVKMTDLIDGSSFTKDMVTHYFKSLSRLEEAAREAFPESFYDVKIKDIIGPKKLAELQDAVKKYKRFFITTAVAGCQADTNFLKSIQSYCAKNNAGFLVLVASDPAHVHSKGGYGTIDTDVMAYGGQVVLADTALNSNLYVSTLKLSAKHIDPITGLSRIGQRNGSFIYASPKQRLKATAVSNTKLPHMLMTTGAVTRSNYSTDIYMSERTAYIAENDHVMGGLIIEIEDDKIYHFRQVQADIDGAFIDLGIQYNADESVENIAPEAFVLGDWHSGETDPVAKQAWVEVVQQLGVKKVILHDTFNGLSINHHEDHMGILKAQRAHMNQLDLGSELKVLAQDLDDWALLVDSVVIVKSNHDIFLERYLQDGKYVKDPHNHKLSLHLSLAMLDGKDPLQYGVEMQGLKNPDKIVWLKMDDDYKIAHIQLGAHGHKGSNGSRGSLKAMEAAYGQSVSGHAHTPEILRQSWQTGTSSYLKLSYNSGASSWLHSSCLVYSNGSRQLINVMNGKWKA